jgi:hypothetical protein
MSELETEADVTWRAKKPIARSPPVTAYGSPNSNTIFEGVVLADFGRKEGNSVIVGGGKSNFFPLD